MKPKRCANCGAEVGPKRRAYCGPCENSRRKVGPQVLTCQSLDGRSHTWVLEDIKKGRRPGSCPRHKAENEALKWAIWNANNRTRRRAEKLGTSPVEGPDITWRTVAERDGMNCRYCGVLTVEAHEDRRLWPTHDHVVPLARGGEHSMENAALACFSCNASKGNKLLSEWALVKIV